MIKRIFKFTCLSLLLMINNSCSRGQINKKEFQGVVKFNMKVIPLVDTYDINYDLSILGNRSECYYKKGNYKTVTHDCYYIWDLFLKDENKEYFYTKQSDTLYWIDVNINDSRVIEYKIEDSTTIIAGFKCNILTMKSKPIDKEEPICIRKIYFAKELYTNPSYSKNYNHMNQNFILEKIHSIALKTEIEFPNRRIIFEAYEVDTIELDDSIFKLDKWNKYKKLN